MHAEICATRLYREDLRQHKLVSSKAFEAGDVVARFRARAEHDEPSWLTVQVSEDVHIVLDPDILASLNHCCDPNVFLDVQAMCLVALRPILVGDELTFFYPSTEWDMAEPFECGCGSAECIGRIAGARETPLQVLARYRLNPHIIRLIGASAISEGG
jgi:hypothetical protein